MEHFYALITVAEVILKLGSILFPVRRNGTAWELKLEEIELFIENIKESFVGYIWGCK